MKIKLHEDRLLYNNFVERILQQVIGIEQEYLTPSRHFQSPISQKNLRIASELCLEQIS